MIEDTSKQEAPELEEDAEEGEPEEGHPEDGHEERQRVEEPRTQTAPRREGGGWLSKLIWLVILALIVWGGWTAYKRSNATAPETPSEESAQVAPI